MRTYSYFLSSSPPRPVKKLLLPFLALSFLALPSALLAAGDPLPVLAAPDFKTPLDSAWKIAHGRYEPKDGVLVCSELPENKHVAVLWHQIGWDTGVIECEFRFDGSRSLILGSDTAGPQGFTHVGRVVITPTQISLAEDSIKPSHTLAKIPATLAVGQWHTLRLEWRGDRLAVRVNALTLETQHAFFATAKARSWIAVGGQTTSIRALTIRGVAHSPSK